MTLSLHSLKSYYSRKKRIRVGRGNAAGRGTYSGRGLKGQKSRSGGNIPPGFEGGRTTIIAQTPKMRGKGFKSGRLPARGINVQQLNVFNDGDIVSLKRLIKLRMVKSGPVKILGQGELKKKLEVRLPASEQAKQKIEKAGGNVVNKKTETQKDPAGIRQNVGPDGAGKKTDG